jgi:hypothetical protein
MAAQTATWNAGTVGDWFTAGNWTPAVVPTAGYTAHLGSGTAIVSANSDAVQGVSILLGGLATGEPVILQADGATFEGLGVPPNETDMVITVVGGNPFLSPLNATFLVKGRTTYDGQILVEAQGGGLTIDVQALGSTRGQFVFDNTDQKAVMVVEQESVLTFAGGLISNGGLIEVEGGFDIEAGVTFAGTGLVALEDGGRMTISGTVGRGQQIGFADQTGLVTLIQPQRFHGTLGFSMAGARIDLAGLDVQSLAVELPAQGEVGHLNLYSEAGQQGQLLASLAVQNIGSSLGQLDFDLASEDFSLSSDGAGGTLVTYAPDTGIFLQQSLATPIVAAAGTIVTFASILENAFGTANPGFTQIALLHTPRFQSTSTNIGYWEPSDITPTWYLNGQKITGRTVITADQIDDVTLEVGNQIADPARFEAVVTPDITGPDSETITYNAWSVDPRIVEQVQGAGFDGPPTPDGVVASAVAFNQVFGQILNNNLCNWIADNVAAGAGASMPDPNADLDPLLNVEGGFWRIAYSSALANEQGVPPVSNWGTLVQPGDIVRMGWFKPETGAESGHTTTVLAVGGTNGTITSYDNIDDVLVDGTKHEYIGIHGDVSYWVATDPLYITIYRLDPNQQYLIQGTALGETIAGSVFDDLIHPGGGGDTISVGPGSDEIQDTTANLDGATVNGFATGDRFDFTDLDPTLATVSFANGVLSVGDGTHSASLTVPGLASQVFVVTPDGNGGSFIDRLNKVTIAGTYPGGYALAPTAGRLSMASSAVVGGSGVRTTGAHASIIINAGTVLADSSAIGVAMAAGGSLTNGSAANAGASIFGGTGVAVNGFGVVTNYGVIGSTTGRRALAFNSADSRLIEYASGQLDGAVYGGGGTLELARSSLAGTLGGLGTEITGFADIEIDARATWSFAAGSSLANGTSLTNSGTLALAGQLANKGEIRNEVGATFDLQGDFGIGKTGRFFNDGTLVKSAGDGLSLIQAGGLLTSSGRIVVESGTLELAGSLLEISGPIGGGGTIAFGPGATTLFDPSVTTAGLAITGRNASLVVSEGETLYYRGSFSSGPGTTLGTAGPTNSTTAAGRVQLLGEASFERSTVGGFGQLITRGPTSVDGVTLGGFATWDNLGALVETGTLAFAANSAGSFANHDGAVFTLQGRVGIASPSQENVFSNAGQLIKSGGSVSTISSALDNNGGVVEVAAGRLVITGDVSGRGTLQIDAGQTLEIGGAVGSQQTVVFSGGNDDLILDAAASFAGRLSNFGAGDRLDFAGFDPATATLGFVQSGGKGTLTITDSTHTAQVTLLGQYAASGFRDRADGAGGTLVTYAPPPESSFNLAAHAG